MKNLLRLILLFCFFYYIQLNTFAQKQSDSITIASNGAYIINSGNTMMKIDPKVGGRITSFKLGDYEFLTGKDIQPDNYGSTFWPSPQSAWNWPPPAVLDNEPYEAVDNGKSIIVTSGKDPVTGFQFIKEFSSGSENRMEVTYTIANISGEVKRAAPWEISRARKGGLLFFPAGETPVHRKSFEMAPTENIDGIVWYQDPGSRPDNNQLSISDGSEGWLAYAINGKLLIKKFEDVKPDKFAPGEAEISLYVSREADYIEIEVQGKYESINPGEKSIMHIEWIASDIPSNINVEKGNKELVTFVRGIVK